MKKKNDNDQIDLNRAIIAGAANISLRVMTLSNQGLINYTPDQLLPDDNPDLCILISTGVISTLACDLLIKNPQYTDRRRQLETQVQAILAQGSDTQTTVEQINQAIAIECEKVIAENQELIEKETEKRVREALDFIKDKYKTRFEWMMTSLILDSVLSVSPISISPSIVRSIHALEDWIVQDDLKLPKKESGGTKPEYDLTKLPDYYRELLEIWQSAKRDAQKAQNDPLLKSNWRKRTQASYACDLPDDLIEWLNENEQERQVILGARTDLTYLPKKLLDGYVLCKPSEIAIEHSARLCGAPPYYYSISGLFEIKRKKQALWFKSTL